GVFRGEFIPSRLQEMDRQDAFGLPPGIVGEPSVIAAQSSQYSTFTRLPPLLYSTREQRVSSNEMPRPKASSSPGSQRLVKSNPCPLSSIWMLMQPLLPLQHNCSTMWTYPSFKLRRRSSRC